MATFFAYDSGRNPTTQPLLGANVQSFLNTQQTTVSTALTANVNTFTSGAPGTITVSSTATFTANPAAVVQTNAFSAVNPNGLPLLWAATSEGIALLSYTGTTATTFTGCVYLGGQAGTIASGAAIDSPTESFFLSTGVASRIVGSIYSEQSGSLAILQSFDGLNWDIGNTVTVTGGTVNSGINQETIAPYVTFLYSNGTTTQTVFRFFVRVFGNGRQGA